MIHRNLPGSQLYMVVSTLCPEVAITYRPFCTICGWPQSSMITRKIAGTNTSAAPPGVPETFRSVSITEIQTRVGASFPLCTMVILRVAGVKPITTMPCAHVRAI